MGVSDDGDILRLWREQPELGEPDPDGDRVNRLVGSEGICWRADDCERQGIGSDGFVCTEASRGPGECLVID